MAITDKIHIIGVGDDGLDGLSEAGRQTIHDADVLIGSTRNLQGISETSAERLNLGTDLDQLVQMIEQRGDKSIVVLTTGDPLFYGVARFLCDRFGKDRFEILPHVSTMQLAFARVKESWDEAYLANLAKIALNSAVAKIRGCEKAGLFTTEAVAPADVARTLIDQQIDYFTAYVCENLGSPDERVTQGELFEIADQSFSPLNVLVLVRKPELPDRPIEMKGQGLFGNADELFMQSRPKRGLLTSREVRAVALALLDLGPASVVWDVGAGSGSLSIESAMIASDGITYAIEMDPEDHQILVQNAERFAVSNIIQVLGTAPDVWKDLPDPDAVFIGGTGRAVATIAAAAFQRLADNGRLVANVTGVGNLSAVRECLQRLTGDLEIRMINVARSTHQLDEIRFEAANPTFLISAIKSDS